MIKKLMLVIVALAIVSVAAVAAVGCGDLPKSAVAEVNGKVITKEDLDSKIDDIKQQYGQQGGLPQAGTPEYADFQKQVAEELVSEEVMWFEADKRGLTVSEDDVNKQIDQIKQSAGGDQQFQKELDQYNITLDHLKDNIRKGLLYQKLLADVTKDQPQVTDAQAQDYYNQHQADGTFNKPETRTVEHILVADQATAEKVKAQLDAGGDFAALAKQYSTDTSTKDKGGSLGDVPSQNSGLAPEFEAAMDKLQAGQTSDPVKTQFGWHIIRVTAVTPAGVTPFAQVKDQIKSQLMQDQQQTAFMKWLDDTKKNYTITYADEFNPNITTPATGATGATGAPPAAGSTQPAPAASGGAQPAAPAPSATP